jgi:diguanylate cyclase (GGDEF)-like protein
MVINITDVSERHDYEEQLAFQARHDALTGLANRGLFRERLERLVATIGSASVNSVLYIDLDDFKRINDTLCHQAGDDLLLAIGERLVALVRPEDLVDRLGSDEFAVLLESTDAHMAVAATKRILGALQRPLSLGGRDVLPRASVGIATTMPGGIGGDSLLGDADLAMYFAKRNGKAQYRVFSAEMRSDLVDRLQLGEDLRAAIESGSLEVHYQPIIDMPSGTIVGAETLARWHHPTRGWVGPAVFILSPRSSALSSASTPSCSVRRARRAVPRRTRGCRRCASRSTCPAAISATRTSSRMWPQRSPTAASGRRIWSWS